MGDEIYAEYKEADDTLRVWRSRLDTEVSCLSVEVYLVGVTQFSADHLCRDYEWYAPGDLLERAAVEVRKVQARVAKRYDVYGRRSEGSESESVAEDLRSRDLAEVAVDVAMRSGWSDLEVRVREVVTGQQQAAGKSRTL